jgi:hypothetical protein
MCLETSVAALSVATRTNVGWAKAQSAVPTDKAEFGMVGTLRLVLLGHMCDDIIETLELFEMTVFVQTRVISMA